MRVSLTLLAIVFALGACKKSPLAAPDAGAPGPPERVPAPNSTLARELGANDAGRGDYRLFDDGPWCGFAPRVDRNKPLDRSASSPPPESAWLGFYETKTAPPDGPRLYERAAYTLSLTGPSRARAGEALALALSLANGSAQPLHYGMPVEGSFEHWRGPFVDLYARHEGLGKTFRWTFGKGFGRCGNVDYRKPEDFVMLAPGQKKLDPFGPRSHTALAPVVMMPGRYTLWVVYASSCVGPELASNYGGDAPPPADRFEGTIASNGITVDVAPEP